MLDLAAANAFTAFGGPCVLIGAIVIIPSLLTFPSRRRWSRRSHSRHARSRVHEVKNGARRVAPTARLARAVRRGMARRNGARAQRDPPLALTASARTAQTLREASIGNYAVVAADWRTTGALRAHCSSRLTVYSANGEPKRRRPCVLCRLLEGKRLPRPPHDGNRPKPGFAADRTQSVLEPDPAIRDRRACNSLLRPSLRSRTPLNLTQL